MIRKGPFGERGVFIKGWLLAALVLFVSGCSQDYVAKSVSNWCKTNPDCDHYGEEQANVPK